MEKRADEGEMVYGQPWFALVPFRQGAVLSKGVLEHAVLTDNRTVAMSPLALFAFRTAYLVNFQQTIIFAGSL